MLKFLWHALDAVIRSSANCSRSCGPSRTCNYVLTNRVRAIAGLGTWRGRDVPEPWRQRLNMSAGGAGRRVGARAVGGAQRGAAENQGQGGVRLWGVLETQQQRVDAANGTPDAHGGRIETCHLRVMNTIWFLLVMLEPDLLKFYILDEGVRLAALHGRPLRQGARDHEKKESLQVEWGLADALGHESILSNPLNRSAPRTSARASRAGRGRRQSSRGCRVRCRCPRPHELAKVVKSAHVPKRPRRLVVKRREGPIQGISGRYQRHLLRHAGMNTAGCEGRKVCPSSGPSLSLRRSGEGTRLPPLHRARAAAVKAEAPGGDCTADGPSHGGRGRQPHRRRCE